MFYIEAMSTLFIQIQFKDYGDTLNLLYRHHNFLFEQVDWSIYYKIFLKDKLKGMVSKREKCSYIKQRERNKSSIDAQLVFWYLS